MIRSKIGVCWKEAYLEIVKEIQNTGNDELIDIAMELRALAEQWELEVELEMRKIRASYQICTS